MKTWQFSPLTQLRRFPISFLNFSLPLRSKPKETITALSKKINYWKIRLALCPRKFLNVETVRTLHFLSDEYDDLTASIYVLVQLKQITHCLNALSSQVEPDAEEYSYQCQNTQDEIARFRISETWRKHRPLCFRYVSVRRKREIQIIVASFTFPLCFLNGNANSRFRHVSDCRFPLVFVSVTFLSTDLLCVCYA